MPVLQESASLDLARLVLPEIRALLARDDRQGIRDACENFHGPDLQHLYEQLPVEEQIQLFESLDRQWQIELFEFLFHDDRFALIDRVSRETRIGVLNEISPDDRADFFSDLPENLMQKLLGELDPQERLYTLALLRCPERSAGRIMTPEFISVRATSSIRKAYKSIRRAITRVETIYVIYAVDEDGKLVGTLSLRELLASKFNARISDLMTTDPIHAYVTTNQEELAEIAQRYDLFAVPITTSDNRLVGIVTYDDIHDVVDEEATEDVLRMHGVAAQMDSYFDASIGTRLRQRMVVLASLATVSIVSVILQLYYNDIVTQVSVLAIYLTLLAGSTGNCGTQIAGIIIRAQTLREYTDSELRRMLGKEVVVGALMALMMSVAVFGLTYLMFWGMHPPVESMGGHSISTIAVVVAVAMFTALITINVLGGSMPVLMKRIGLDPAITAGPFITTAADITTVLIYFNVAGWLLR